MRLVHPSFDFACMVGLVKQNWGKNSMVFQLCCQLSFEDVSISGQLYISRMTVGNRCSKLLTTVLSWRKASMEAYIFYIYFKMLCVDICGNVFLRSKLFPSQWPNFERNLWDPWDESHTCNCFNCLLVRDTYQMADMNIGILLKCYKVFASNINH